MKIKITFSYGELYLTGWNAQEFLEVVTDEFGRFTEHAYEMPDGSYINPAQIVRIENA